MFCISLTIQARASFYIAEDILRIGKVNFASAFAYFTSLPFSVATYLIAFFLIYIARNPRLTKWIHAYYFGLHLILLLLIFARPGRFAP